MKLRLFFLALVWSTPATTPPIFNRRPRQCLADAVTFVPLVWDIVNVQLHAGRSKVRNRSPPGVLGSAIKGGYLRSSPFRGRRLSRRISSVYLAFSGKQHVVPTEQQELPVGTE